MVRQNKWYPTSSISFVVEPHETNGNCLLCILIVGVRSPTLEGIFKYETSFTWIMVKPPPK